MFNLYPNNKAIANKSVKQLYTLKKRLKNKKESQKNICYHTKHKIGWFQHLNIKCLCIKNTALTITVYKSKHAMGR